MAPCGVVGIVVGDVSSCSVSLYVQFCDGEGLGTALLGLLEDGAGVTDGDGDELHFTP